MIKNWLNHLFNYLLKHLIAKDRPHVFIENDHVIGIDRKRRFSVPLNQIQAILHVFYENPGSFTTDEFVVLLLKEHFFLIGACTQYSIGTMHQIKELKPSLTITSVWFEHIPWRLRDRGCLGLRLFDLAGMGIFPLRYLPPYRKLDS